ncbi:glucose 1-dehydrogenase [Mycobacterium sp. 94-17]|uniref:SDR family NAD(P)-dependent oxidoreductase n=1 Tax=Mycobacterium sp. 94-17 TaxID=2986147 RepID=UPI002D1EED9B|nr:glucose 1-dehydrogenase [Mycobacterium sp. 94-17]MEB4209784.1 glucose 1-dehydrogenase [Mycobacterium sp. 94-17]
MFDLTNRVALVTGSTKGLGRAMAQAFALAGASVVISSRDQERCTAVATDIHEQTGAATVGVAWHASDWEAAPAIVERIVDAFGTVDVLVNNAGINPASQSAAAVSLELWRKVFSVDLEGPLRMSQCVAPVMRERGGGSIINIGSMAAYAAHSQSVAYGAAKAALRSLTVTMAHEFAAWGIRVNLLSPGPFATEMVAGAERHQPGFLEMLARSNPQKRVATLDEIVGPALYLASDAASFVTGDDITVSGGMRK